MVLSGSCSFIFTELYSLSKILCKTWVKYIFTLPVTQLLYNTGVGKVIFQLNQQAVLCLACFFGQLAFEPPSRLWTDLSYLHASSPPESTPNAYHSEISEAVLSLYSSLLSFM